MADTFNKEDRETKKVVRKYKEDYGEEFLSMLDRLMEERGLKDGGLSRLARMDRRVLYKIRKGICRPSAETVARYAIAMRLSYKEMDELLRSAGLALKSTDFTEAALSICVSLGIYDWETIDGAIEECRKISRDELSPKR